MPKFPKTKEDQLSSIVEKWIYFFRYADETSEEELERIIGNDLITKRAYEELNRFNWSEKEFIAYEQEIKRIVMNRLSLLKNSMMLNKKAIQIGHEKGKIEGIAEGKKQAKIAVPKTHSRTVSLLMLSLKSLAFL